MTGGINISYRVISRIRIPVVYIRLQPVPARPVIRCNKAAGYRIVMPGIKIIKPAAIQFLTAKKIGSCVLPAHRSQASKGCILYLAGCISKTIGGNNKEYLLP